MNDDLVTVVVVSFWFVGIHKLIPVSLGNSIYHQYNDCCCSTRIEYSQSYNNLGCQFAGDNRAKPHHCFPQV
jgi:hypothetical protein